MNSLRRLAAVGVLTLASLVWTSATRLSGARAADLPDKLTDQEFWQLIEDLSEANGSFPSETVLSSENVFASTVPALVAQTRPGGVYLGVGPEQNFTYIAAMKARMAFITDSRRGNLPLQLMYKALFELSVDRADFIGRLFTKPRPPSLTSTSSIGEIMGAYWNVPSLSEPVYAANLAAIRESLTKTHGFRLSAEDLDGIGRAYRAFYWYGPVMNYSSGTSFSVRSIGGGVTFRELMTQADANGNGLTFLASHEKFAFTKDLEARNLIVPVVGDFAGPKALRAIGAYVRAHDATVSAFYVANAEGPLRRDGTWPAFCANVAAMPLDARSVLIRPSGMLTLIRPANPVAGQPPGVFPYVLGAGVVPIADAIKNCGG